jgi:glutamyl-tRNA synthetase
VRPNLERFEDATQWHKVCFGDIDPVIEETDFINAAAGLLPPEPWDQTTWKKWTGMVKDKTGRKGKELFLPLRLALTGLDHGPELKELLPLIGGERVLKRLTGES